MSYNLSSAVVAIGGTQVAGSPGMLTPWRGNEFNFGVLVADTAYWVYLTGAGPWTGAVAALSGATPAVDLRLSYTIP